MGSFLNRKTGKSFLQRERAIQSKPERIYLRAVLLGLIFLLLFLESGKFYYQSADTVPYALLPFSILYHHSFYLGRYFSASFLASHPYFLHYSHGHYVGYRSSIGTSLTALPIYFIYYLAGGPASLTAGAIMGKFAASIVSALSAALVYILLRKVSIRSWIALVFTALYAIGSETYTISSQSLWRHGSGELWLVVFLLSVVRIVSKPENSKAASLFAGLAMGMLFFCRPQNFILVLPFVLLSIKKEYRKPILWSIPLLVLSVVAYEWYKHTFFYQPPTVLGGMGMAGEVGKLHGSLIGGLLGNLLSPSRGLFVFMPWTLFSFMWIRYVRHTTRWRILYVLLSVSVVLYILMYSKLAYWDAGLSYGGRYMTDILPALALLAALYFELALTGKTRRARWQSGLRNGLLALFGVWSVGVQLLGANVLSGANWNAAVSPDQNHSNMWRVRFGEIPYYVHSFIAENAPPQIVRDPKVAFGGLTLRGVPQNGSITLAPNRGYASTLVVKNTGEGPWPAYAADNGQGFVQLVYTVWKNGKRVTLAHPTGGFITLLHTVKPGQNITTYFNIRTPAQPGHYTYTFTLEQNGYGQFGHGPHSKNTLTVPVTVKAN